MALQCFERTLFPSQIILFFILVSCIRSHALYRAFSSAFANGITLASDFCPPVQEKLINSKFQGMKISKEVQDDNIILINDFGPETSSIPACTFRSKGSKNAVAFLLGGFLSYDVFWNIGRNVIHHQCPQRYKLQVHDQIREIVIPKMLCGVPARLSKSNLTESTDAGFVRFIRPALWLFSSGDFGFTFPFPGHLFSRNDYGMKYPTKPRLAYLIFKTLLENECSIRVEQYTLTSSCEDDLHLPFGCIVYNCSYEDRIFDYVNRLTNIISKSKPEPQGGYIVEKTADKGYQEQHDWSGQSQNDQQAPKEPKSVLNDIFIPRWVPGVIIFALLIFRIPFWKRMSTPCILAESLTLDLHVELDERDEGSNLIPDAVNPRFELLPPIIDNNQFNELSLVQSDVIDLPPPYESLSPPSYADVVAMKNIKSTCV